MRRRLTLTCAAVAAVVLLDGAARADVETAPAGDAAAEIACGGPEWPALVRALAAYCGGGETGDGGCDVARARFRRCDGAPQVVRVTDGMYRAIAASDERSFEIWFVHHRRWRVEAIEEQDECASPCE
jgi:hypothetical protein